MYKVIICVIYVAYYIDVYINTCSTLTGSMFDARQIITMDALFEVWRGEYLRAKLAKILSF